VANLVKLNPGLASKFQTAAVKATMPYFFPPANEPWGWQNPTPWNAYGQWMMSNHLISNPNVLANPDSNEILAGQGI
jgi:hypothetical protein